MFAELFSADFATMALLLGTGIFFTARSGAFQLRGVRFLWKNTAGSLLKRDRSGKGITPFQAVTTALAGTMGVGNIAGVATALVAGGPGAIFWMWVSAFFGMATKYAEIFLAVKYRRRDGKGGYYGGAMYYMRDGLGSPALAALFAVLCTLCSLGIGNMAQMNSVSGAMRESFGIPAPVSGVVFALLTALVVFGGVRRIARVTELVIPFLSVLYLAFSGVFLYLNRGAVPDALLQIVRGAFGMRSAAGGVMGYAAARAVRLGLSRGVFTNEAGLGSAPIAHACADSESPARQAAWGVFEVFLDTIVVCTVTALVILCAGGGSLWTAGLDGAPLTAVSFESAFPGLGSRFVAVSVAFFAFAAMVGWCFYGETALRYLFGGRGIAVISYRLAFLGCVLLGAVAELRVVWGMADILNALMAVPNCLALLLLRGEIRWGDS